jgi:hypothetical protein
LNYFKANLFGKVAVFIAKWAEGTVSPFRRTGGYLYKTQQTQEKHIPGLRGIRIRDHSNQALNRTSRLI